MQPQYFRNYAAAVLQKLCSFSYIHINNGRAGAYMYRTGSGRNLHNSSIYEDVTGFQFCFNILEFTILSFPFLSPIIFHHNILSGSLLCLILLMTFVSVSGSSLFCPGILFFGFVLRFLFFGFCSSVFVLRCCFSPKKKNKQKRSAVQIFKEVHYAYCFCPYF